MNKSVKKLYIEAKNNEAFKKDFREQDPEYMEPKFWWRETTKTIFACYYAGWLMRGREFKDRLY